MKSLLNVSGALVLLAALLTWTTPARAQVRQIPTVQQLYPYNPYWQVFPGVSMNQYLYNMQAFGMALQQFPPYLYGYNPYPPVYYQQYYMPPVYPSYNYYNFYRPMHWHRRGFY